ncbi:Phosphate-regulating neutral endopeptidase [Aphelenchoides besseyi]|nr:Phosphate-regulating neutral endopeptidase [Aphelenchoides besseyi]
MAGSKVLRIALLFVTLIVSFVVLGVSIAILIKVYQSNSGGKGGDGGAGGAEKNDLNIKPPVTLSPGGGKTTAFTAYIDTLKASINTSFDPCNDFFMQVHLWFLQRAADEFRPCRRHQYGSCCCRSKEGSGLLSESNKLIGQLQKTNIGKEAAYHFKKCVEAYKDPKQIHGDGQVITGMYNDYKAKAGIDFPLFTPNWSGARPSAEQMAKAVGVLSGTYLTDTFVSSGIDTNWKHPSDNTERPYAVLIDQTSLLYPDTYYTKAWDVFKDGYVNKSEKVLTYVANKLGVTLDTNQMAKDVQAIADMELHIAKEINSPEVQRRNYTRMYNPITIADANNQFKLINFATYLQLAMNFASQEVRDLVLKTPNYKVIFQEMDQLKKLTDYLNTVDARTIYNYFYFRLLVGRPDLLPENYNNIADGWLREKTGHLGRKRVNRWRRLPPQHPDEVGDDDSAIDGACAEENAGYLAYINGRFFLDELLPTEDKRKELRDHVALITAKVLEGFQNQLDQLSWMTDNTKSGAYDKIKYLTRNMGYPSWITDDQKLEDYYKNLKVDMNSDYRTVIAELTRFAVYIQMQNLLLTDQTIRDDFGSSPSIVNAWYQPEVNSITFPLGILQEPFFNVNYPASVNYGAFGVVAGHELTHGFDDEGVQWDGVGRLRTWMDDQTSTGFTSMASCVVNQYNQFSPTPGFNVDGTQTQGENIADNGGIRAAYNAYQAHKDFYGDDPRLPDDKFNEFTPEQLFFLGFARVWCEANPSAGRLQRQVLVDPHSPSQFRVLGTMQNFPAFRSAFNCPVGSKYGPKDHCDVWSSEVQVVTGIPPTPAATTPKAMASFNRAERFNSTNFS